MFIGGDIWKGFGDYHFAIGVAVSAEESCVLVSNVITGTSGNDSGHK